MCFGGGAWRSTQPTAQRHPQRKHPLVDIAHSHLAATREILYLQRQHTDRQRDRLKENLHRGRQKRRLLSGCCLQLQRSPANF